MTSRPVNPDRRSFIRGTAIAAVTTAGSALAGRVPAADQPTQAPARNHLVDISFKLNGERVQRGVDPRRTLLDQLRESEGLTGTKPGCRHGQCGACTVHVDGEPRLSCLTLAVQIDGSDVTTIEGLAAVAIREGHATEDGLHPLQAQFVDHDAFQCGYCTPGQIMSGSAILREGHAGSETEIRELMSGNLCRCAAYPNITAAMVAARKSLDGGSGAQAEAKL